MKEVTVHSWCDWNHSSADGRIPAEVERIITLNGGNPVVVDLCTAHARLLSDLVEAGSSVADQPVDPVVAERTCPDCRMVCASRSALGQHTRKMHGKGLREYAASA